MINNTTITRATDFVKLACKVLWPEDQQFYVLHQKDVWSDLRKEREGGKTQRKANQEEWEQIRGVLEQHAAPWKRQCREEHPTPPFSSPAAFMEAFGDTPYPQRASESSGTPFPAVPNVNKNIKSETVGTTPGVKTEDP